MAHQYPPDLKQQLKEQMATGLYDSEAEVLREALRALKRQDQDLAAVKEAISDMEAGDRGIPFDHFVEDFRTRHNIPQDA